MKYEDLQWLAPQLKRGHFFSSIDLKSGYHHIPLHKDDSKYISFCWKGVVYDYLVLPFGLAPACYIFTKFLKPVVRKWRDLGIVGLQYLDDTGLVSASQKDNMSDTCEVLDIVQTANLRIETSKTEGVPSRDPFFLGVVINFVLGTFGVPQYRHDRIIEKANFILSSEKISARDVAELAGSIASLWLALGKNMVARTLPLCAWIQKRVISAGSTPEAILFSKKDIRDSWDKLHNNSTFLKKEAER